MSEQKVNITELAKRIAIVKVLGNNALGPNDVEGYWKSFDAKTRNYYRDLARWLCKDMGWKYERGEGR